MFSLLLLLYVNKCRTAVTKYMIIVQTFINGHSYKHGLRFRKIYSVTTIVGHYYY